MTTKTGQPLQAKPFSSKPTLIPEFVEGKFTGRPYKAEQVLIRGNDGGSRLHVWFAADPRPHNHPWTFIDCKVLRGGYTAVEYRPKNGSYEEVEVTLSAGDPEHRVNYETHHQVIGVQPGTVTIMTFGPVVGDGKQWGNLVREASGAYRYEPNTMQPGFLDALRHLNAHMRPDGWVDPYAAMAIPDLNELMTAAGL